MLLSRWIAEPASVSEAELNVAGISAEQLRSIAAQLGHDLEHFADKLGRDSEGVAEVLRLLRLLELYGLRDWVRFDASVVRGLAYYTGLVFEAFDTQGALRAVCGGGRYDHMLLPMFVVHGEYPTAAAGFAFNDHALEAVLSSRRLIPDFAAIGGASCDVALVCCDQSAETGAYGMTRSLRDAGLSVDLQVACGRSEDELLQTASLRSKCVVIASSGGAGETVLRRIDSCRPEMASTFSSSDASELVRTIVESCTNRG